MDRDQENARRDAIQGRQQQIDRLIASKSSPVFTGSPASMLISRTLISGLISVCRHDRLLRIADMNHVLKHAAPNTDQSELYRDPDRPIVSEVIEGISPFLLE